MMRLAAFKDWLKTQIPSILKAYVGAINKNDTQCIGIYRRGNASPYIAVGGVACTTFAYTPVTILVHWTENADTCEIKANEIYEKLFGATNFMVGTTRVISVNLLDPCPIDVGRDDKNIAECVIRLNIIYEREVQ